MARQGWAGEKSGLFEHPEWCATVVPDVQADETPVRTQSFFGVASWPHEDVYQNSARLCPDRCIRVCVLHRDQTSRDFRVAV